MEGNSFFRIHQLRFMDDKIKWFDWRSTRKHEESVIDAMKSGWISNGPYVEACAEILEKKFKRPALLVSNGTVAIDLAFWSLGIGVGDEVLIPSYSFLAAYNSCIRNKIHPKLYDVNVDTLCPTLEEIKRVTTSRTKCIVIVYNYGMASSEILDIIHYCRGEGIQILEDIAESFGSQISDNLTGKIGDIATCSFHATKTITSGEGGVVLFQNQKAKSKASKYISHGLERKGIDYFHSAPGTNYRLSNILAALLFTELGLLESTIELKKHIFNRYNSSTFSCFDKFNINSGNLLWAYPLKYNGSRNISEVKLLYQNEGIEVRTGFIPPHVLPCFEKKISKSYSFKNAEFLAKKILILPSHKYLSEREIDRIIHLTKRVND